MTHVCLRCDVAWWEPNSTTAPTTSPCPHCHQATPTGLLRDLFAATTPPSPNWRLPARQEGA